MSHISRHGLALALATSVTVAGSGAAVAAPVLPTPASSDAAAPGAGGDKIRVPGVGEVYVCGDTPEGMVSCAVLGIAAVAGGAFVLGVGKDVLRSALGVIGSGLDTVIGSGGGRGGHGSSSISGSLDGVLDGSSRRH